MNNNMDSTMRFSIDKEKQKKAREIIIDVFAALDEKGYNSTDQFIGYLLSGDPTYITSHNNARRVIRQLERDELLEELIGSYLNKQ
ncbi:MAG: IreB family regulatory phosphoprotein [Clostridiales bacterium]|nr:IreB family regulatory phosphoprotein [Clostridiales bacterium]